MSLETLLGPTREDDLKEQSQTELDKYFTNLKENIKDYPDEKLNQMIQQGDYLATMAMRFRNDMRRPQQPMGEQPPVAQQIIGENRQLAGIGTGGMPNAEAISPMAAEGVGALPDQMAPFARDNTGILGAEAPMTMTAAEGGLIELAGGGEVIPFQNRGLVPDFRPRSYSQPFGYFARDPYFIGRNISTDPTMALDPNSSYRGALEGLSLDEQLEFLRRQEEANMGLGGSIVNYPQRSTGPLIDDKERVGRDITGFDYRTDRVANIKAQLAQPGISDTEKERLQKELFFVDRPSPKLENYQTVTPENITDPFLSESNIGKNIEASPATNTGIMLTRPSDARRVEAGSIRERADQGNLGLGAFATDVANQQRAINAAISNTAKDIGSGIASTAGTIGSGIEDSFVGRRAKGMYGGLKALTDSAFKGTFTKDLKAFWNDSQSQEEMQKLPFIFGKELSDDPMVREAQLSSRKELLEDVGPTVLTTALLWPLQTAKTVAAVPYFSAKGLKSLLTTQGGRTALKVSAVAGSAAYTNQDKLPDIFDQEKARLAREAEKNKNEINKDIPENEKNQLDKNTKAGLNQANKALDSIEKEVKQEIKDVDKIDKKEKKSAMDAIKQRFKTAVSEPEFNDFLIATGISYASGGELAEAAEKQWPNYIKQRQEREKLQAAERIASDKIKLGERKLDVTSRYYKDLIAAKALDSRIGEKDIMKALADNQDYINLDIMRLADALVKEKSSFFSTYELDETDIANLEKQAVDSFLRRIGVGGLGTPQTTPGGYNLAEAQAEFARRQQKQQG